MNERRIDERKLIIRNLMGCSMLSGAASRPGRFEELTVARSTG
jgi:hypothetical protein